MNIFITGGTGTIGNILVTNLLDQDHNVTVITRNKDSVENHWKDKVTLVEGNVQEKGDWTSSVEGHDGIVNLVGENIFGKRWTDSQKDRLYHSRVDSTQNLVDLVLQMSNPPEVFVSVSGTDYYPASEDKIFTEEDESGNTFLANLTRDWEKPVHELASTDTRHVIFRMGVAFTKTGKAAERMFMTHKFFVGGWIGSGRQIYSWTHQDDFAGLLQWALENDQVEGTYNGVAPDYKPMKELAQIGGEIMGRWTWTWAPGFMLKLILGERADILLKGRVVSSEKVREAGYEFKYPTAEEALADILEDF